MTDFATLSTWPSNSSAKFFTQPVETLLRFNADIITAFQSATLSWLQRRQEAAKESIESFGKLVCCRDIGEAMAIQREWLERSIHRLDEDFSAFAHQAPDVLPDPASAEVNVVATTVEAGAQALASEILDTPQNLPLKTVSQQNKEPNHRKKTAKSSRGRHR